MSLGRVLVTGAAGQLGQDVVRAARAEGLHVTAATRDVCDITEAKSVRAALDSSHANVVVNCAGWTDVEGAETHRGEAFALNARGPELLAAECASRDARLLHVSTDYVFDGRARRPIDESATPAPLSVYGSSKLAGEVAVLGAGAAHTVVRTAWLFGGGGPNFVLTILRRAQQGGSLRVVDDQRGTPTWTGHLAPALLRLLEHGGSGTVHLTNSGDTTWYGFAVEVVRLAELGGGVTPIRTSEYPTRAARPAYTVLDNAVWRSLGEPALPPWQEGVAAYLAEVRSTGGLTPARP